MYKLIVNSLSFTASSKTFKSWCKTLTMSTSEGQTQFKNETSYVTVTEPAVPPQGQSYAPPPAPYAIPPPPLPQVITTTTARMPNDYYALALFVTICCCLPFGIVGLMKSTDARNQFDAGNIAGAEHSAREAKRYSYLGLGIGICIITATVIFTIIYVVVVVAAVAD